MKNKSNYFWDGFRAGFYAFAMPADGAASLQSDGEAIHSYWRDVGKFIQGGIDTYN